MADDIQLCDPDLPIGPKHGQRNASQIASRALAEEEHERFKDDLKEEDLRAKVQDREERKKYADKLFFVMCAWLLFLAWVLCNQALSNRGFFLSDTVLKWLIGSTTADIIGLFWLVSRYLFPARGRDTPK